MKGFLVFALCVVAVTANEFKMLLDCAKKEGVIITDKDILYESLLTGRDPPRKIKCFLSCVAKDLEIFVNNVYNGHAAKNALLYFRGNAGDNDRILNVLDDCSKQMKSSDECDRIWELVKCAGPNVPKLMGDFPDGMGSRLFYKTFF